MAVVQKIDSNATNLAYQEEASIGVADTTKNWKPLEPNSYADFGGEIALVARNPINKSRQRKKGVTTDLDASGGFNTDITQTNLQDILQGFFFASLRPKNDTLLPPDNVDATGDTYDWDSVVLSAAVNAAGTAYTVGDVLTAIGGTFGAAATFTVTSITGGGATGPVGSFTVLTGGDYTVKAASFTTSGGTGSGATLDTVAFDTDGMLAGDLIFASGFTDAANNGLKRVTTVGADDVGVAEALANETPPALAKVVRVGFQFAAGDLDVTGTGDLASYTTTTKDLTELGLIPGEWVFVGNSAITDGDFLAAANNGFKRLRSIAANAMVVDKSDAVLTDEASTSETVQIFFGRVLKNENGTEVAFPIKRRTYQLERELGTPDDAIPAQIQAEYLAGSVPNEITWNVPSSDKSTMDLTFLSTDHELIDGPTALKAGTHDALVEADAFNTSSDVTRIKLSQVDATTETPTALFAFVTDLTITLTNNASPNKAVGVLGAFDVSVGQFEVGGSLTAYFSDTAAILAVRNNVDISLDLHLVKANAGITADMPLIALGDGRAAVAQDEPITLPLSNEAATGAKIDPLLDHTFMMIFWDFLPDDADS